MKFFQRAINNSQSYCECKKSEATYYQNAAGSMKPIGELLNTNVNNNFVANVPTHKPLGLPDMTDLINEKSGQVQNITISKSSEPGLPLPSLTQMILEDAKQRNKFNSQNIKPIKNQNYDSHGLPSMDFLIKQQCR